jgi:uncharacterized protein (DUF433 family)
VRGSDSSIAPSWLPVAILSPSPYDAIMSTQPAKQWKYLARKPGSNYQQLFIKGWNIRATSIYSLTVPGEEWPGMTPEEAAAEYDLPLEMALEAIEYCKSNPPEIRADWEMEEALMEATGMNDPNYKYHPQPKMISPQEYAAIVQRFRL